MTSRYLSEMIEAIRDKGYVLIQFDTNLAKPKRSQYDQTTFGGTDKNVDD